MIKRLTRVPRFWIAKRGFEPTTTLNHASLIPTQPDGLASTDFNLPTDYHWKYAQKLSPSEIEARIFSVALSYIPLKGKEFKMEKTWADLGIDSLETIAFVCAIEKEFNCVFEERVFDNFLKPQDIANHMLSNKHAF